jgi:FtsP/CotA-like multicopper oxidase with cupredoxin domain
MNTPDAPPPGSGDDRARELSGVQRAGIALAALAVLLIAFVIVRGGDDSGNETSSTPGAATTQTAPASSAQSPAGDGRTATGGGSASGTTDASPSGTTDDSPTGTTDDSGSETGSTPTATQPARPAVRTIRVVNGQPQGGARTLSYKKGDEVRLKVRSDVADEIHVHGYDLRKDVPAGGTVEFRFKATIEGRFEIELENAHTLIATLEVTPS